MKQFKIGDIVKYHLIEPEKGIPAVIVETHPNIFDSSIQVYTLFLKNTIKPKDDYVSQDLDHIPKGKFGTTTNVTEAQIITCPQKEINKISKKDRLRLLNMAKDAKKNKPKKPNPKAKVMISKDYFVHPKAMFDGEYCSIGSVARITLTDDVEAFGVVTRVIKTNSDFLYDVMLLSSGLEAGIPIFNVRPHRLEYVGSKDNQWSVPSKYSLSYTEILNRIQNGMFD